MLGTVEGPQILGAKMLKEFSTIVFYSLSYNFQKVGKGHQRPPPPLSAVPFRRPWMVSHIFILSCDGRFSYNASHSQTLLQAPRNKGCRGWSPLKYRKFKSKTLAKKPWITPYTFRFSDLPTALCCRSPSPLTWRKYAVAWKGKMRDRRRRHLILATPKALLIKSCGEPSEFEIW